MFFKQYAFQKKVGIFLIITSLALLLLLGFVKKNNDEKDAFLCNVVHESSNYSMSQCPVHTTSTSWLLTISFIVTAIFFGIGLYLFFMQVKNDSEKKPAPAVPFDDLDEDEKKICTLLLEQDGSIYQSDLLKKTEYTKVQLTRLLDKLESKGVLERKRRGMTNIVVLK